MARFRTAASVLMALLAAAAAAAAPDRPTTRLVLALVWLLVVSPALRAGTSADEALIRENYRQLQQAAHASMGSHDLGAVVAWHARYSAPAVRFQNLSDPQLPPGLKPPRWSRPENHRTRVLEVEAAGGEAHATILVLSEHRMAHGRRATMERRRRDTWEKEGGGRWRMTARREVRARWILGGKTISETRIGDPAQPGFEGVQISPAIESGKGTRAGNAREEAPLRERYRRLAAAIKTRRLADDRRWMRQNLYEGARYIYPLADDFDGQGGFGDAERSMRPRFSDQRILPAREAKLRVDRIVFQGKEGAVAFVYLSVHREVDTHRGEPRHHVIDDERRDTWVRRADGRWLAISTGYSGRSMSSSSPPWWLRPLIVLRRWLFG